MKIIFDNDVSSDDVIALIYLLTHPTVSVEAITVAATGEAHGPAGARNLADLCYMLGKNLIPIAYGSDKPCGHGAPFPIEIRDAIDKIFEGRNVPTHPNPIITSSAVELIRITLEKYPDEKIEIVATGPLTNIAEFIQTYPTLISQIEKIVIMGGAVHVPGNIRAINQDTDNVVAEWNVYADAKAADIVFTSGIPVVLVPLDATSQVPMTEPFYKLLSQQQHPVLKLIHELLKLFVDMLGMDVFIKEFFLWDALAAMICVEPSLAITEFIPIKMDLASAQTAPVSLDTEGAALISVATKIPDAELILMRLFNEIKMNLLNVAVRAPQMKLFQLPSAAQTESRQSEATKLPISYKATLAQ